MKIEFHFENLLLLFSIILGLHYFTVNVLLFLKCLSIYPTTKCCCLVL